MKTKPEKDYTSECHLCENSEMELCWLGCPLLLNRDFGGKVNNNDEPGEEQNA